MSDYFTMLVDPHVPLLAADASLRELANALQNRGIIGHDCSEDCVLSGTGYRPGSAIIDYYTPGPNEFPFWQLKTCGVELLAKRGFNHSAIGPSFNGMTCPKCGRTYSDLPDDFIDAVEQWINQAERCTVRCGGCNTEISVDHWDAKNPFGFGNLSITFWNWPPFDRPGWVIDIPDFVKTVMGNAIISTFGNV